MTMDDDGDDNAHTLNMPLSQCAYAHLMVFQISARLQCSLL